MLILCSSLTLVLDNPLNDPNGKVQEVLKIIDVVFTILFSIEAFIKIIAKGLLFNNLGPVLPYLRSYWNILDVVVVLASLIDLIFQVIGIDAGSLQAIKALRALRALRPLRVISRNEQMRLVVNALFASLPSMTNVLLVCSLFILIFSIMGVNFFKGRFYHCIDNFNLMDESKSTYDPSYAPIDLLLIDTKQDCLDARGLWVNRDANFDNVIVAANTLF